MERFRKALLASLFPALLLAGGAGFAAQISARGETTITVTFPFDSFGDFGDIYGPIVPHSPATVDISGPEPILAFPIVGGTAAGDSLTVKHDGAFEIATIYSGVDTFLSDLVLDTSASALLGRVDRRPVVPLFNFGTMSSEGIELLISPELWTEGLIWLFGSDVDLTGATFGFATTDAQVVPLPTALPLLGTAMALLLLGPSAARRRRRTWQLRRLAADG